MHAFPLRGRWTVLWLLAAFASAAQAQPAPRAERPDPLNPQAAVPPATHVSPLAGYKALGTTTVGPWKDANEAVNRIGGWRAYAREAQAPAAPASVPAAR